MDKDAGLSRRKPGFDSPSKQRRTSMFKITCGNCGYEDNIDEFYIRCNVTNLTDDKEETIVKTINIECVICGFHHHIEERDTHIKE